MTKFGLFGSNKGQAIQEFEGERIFNSANPPGLVEIKGKDSQTLAVIRLAEGQSVKEITADESAHARG